MSLIAWYPLNGDVKNYGLEDMELTEFSSPTFVDNGKIGKAMSAGHYKWTAEQTAKILNNEELSITFWIYINCDTGTSIDYSGNILFGNDSSINTEYSNRKFSLFQYPNCNSLHVYWMNDIAGDGAIAFTISDILPSYTWTHVTITYNNPEMKVYINGELVKTASFISKSSTFAYDTSVIRQLSTSYRYLNDFRFYNHCLSKKEIKEISKALILHYPLNNVYETGLKNKFEGEYANGYMGIAQPLYMTRTKLTDENGYNYKLNYTGDGTNYWLSFSTNAFSFTVGKVYWFSCKVRINSATNISSMGMRFSRIDNDYYSGLTARNMFTESGGKRGEWFEVAMYRTFESTLTVNGTVHTVVPQFEIWTDNLSTSGTNYSIDFDIKDICAVECDDKTPFINNSMCDSLICDRSGYGNDGTPSTILPLSNTKIKYNNSYNFPQGSYIKCGDIRPTDALTVHCWACMGTWKNVRLFGCTESGGWTIPDEMNSRTISFWVGTNKNGGNVTENYYTIAYTDISFSELSSGWHMFTCTYDGYVAKVYIDSKLAGISLARETKLPITYSPIMENNLYIHAELSIDHTNNGDKVDITYSTPCLMSDFRVYATALSDDDILDLYNSPVVLDSDANLYGYSFNDNSTNRFNSNGVITSNDIIECGGYNLVYKDYRGDWDNVINSITFNTGTNHCLMAGYIWYSEMVSGEMYRLLMDIEWDGFDTSNTNGTFQLFPQEYRTYKDGTVQWWNARVTDVLAACYIRHTVLSSTSGRKSINVPFSYDSSVNRMNEIKYTYLHFRSDYSNGVGRLTIKNFRVIPEKYYCSSDTDALKMNNDYLSVKNIIEL